MGTSFAFASDEFYCVSGEPLPPAEWYEDYPQIENGVGLLRQFEGEMRQAADDDEQEAPQDAKVYTVVTGVAAADDLSGIDVAGGLTIEAADGETELNVTAAQADGAVVEGFGGATLDKVTVSDLEDALGADLSGVNATDVEVQLDSTGNVEILGSANLANTTVMVSGNGVVTAQADDPVTPEVEGPPDLTNTVFDIGASATVAAEADGSTIPLGSATGDGTFRVENLLNQAVTGSEGAANPPSITVFSFAPEAFVTPPEVAIINLFETGAISPDLSVVIDRIDVQEGFAATDFADVDAQLDGADDNTGLADILSFSVASLANLQTATIAAAFAASGAYNSSAVDAVDFGVGAEKVFWVGTAAISLLTYWDDGIGGAADGLVDAGELQALGVVTNLDFSDLTDLSAGNFIFA